MVFCFSCSILLLFKLIWNKFEVSLIFILLAFWRKQILIRIVNHPHTQQNVFLLLSRSPTSKPLPIWMNLATLDMCLAHRYCNILSQKQTEYPWNKLEIIPTDGQTINLNIIKPSGRHNSMLGSIEGISEENPSRTGTFWGKSLSRQKARSVIVGLLQGPFGPFPWSRQLPCAKTPDYKSG